MNALLIKNIGIILVILVDENQFLRKYSIMKNCEQLI